MKYTIIGILIYGFCFFVLWSIRPNSVIYKVNILKKTISSEVIYCVSLLATVLICVLPMNLSPTWNGQEPKHRNQYELMADSVIQGKVYFDYEVDEKLLEMDNPYDCEMRKELNVDYHWDHAFYNGRYYMYFGVVPVITVFVPYKLITGVSLTTYHATQLFTAFFIIGLFALFRLLTEKLFKEMNNAIFILSCVSFAIMSVWYIAATPALYCTAISSAICFEIWSLFFFFKAVYDTPSENKAIGFAVTGAFFGALTFGCRPPVALANFIAVPLAITFIRSRKTNGKVSKRLLLKLSTVFLPYIIIGILLMWYNYIRFDNVFEFGQSYQLTVADQSNYGNILSRFDLHTILHSLYYYLVQIPKTMKPLDYGMFIAYPISLLSSILMLDKNRLSKIKSKKITALIVTSILSLLVIIVTDSLGSPHPLPRYRMDFYWLAAIIVFIFIGLIYESSAEKKFLNSFLAFFLCLSAGASIVLFLTPYDANFTGYYSPQSLEIIKHIFTLGIK